MRNTDAFKISTMSAVYWDVYIASGFVVYSTRRFVLCLTLCHSVLVFFSPFSIAITSLGEARANFISFRTFCSIRACLDLSVSSSSWCLGRAAVCDCVTPWTFLLPFFYYLFDLFKNPCRHVDKI